MPTAQLTELKTAFDRDGFVIVPGLFTADAVAAWKVALRDALVREQFNHYSGVHVWMGRDLPEPVLTAMFDPRKVEVLTAVIGPDIEYLSSKAVFKSSNTTFPSPWHQDQFYWGGSVKLSVWIALDRATIANGCLKVIPGSHTRKFSITEGDPESFRMTIKDEDLADLRVVDCEVAPGDAIFFHDHLVHASHPNTTGEDRWSLISTYRDGSVVDESKIWTGGVVVSGESVNAKR